MHAYSILTPVTYNNGTPIPSHTFSRLEEDMIAIFGGFTHNPVRLRGAWRNLNGTLCRDTLTTYILFTDSADTLYTFAERVATALRQICISVISADGTATLVYAPTSEPIAA